MATSTIAQLLILALSLVCGWLAELAIADPGDDQFRIATRLAVVFSTILVSWLLYRSIERRRPQKMVTTIVFLALLSVLAVFVPSWVFAGTRALPLELLMLSVLRNFGFSMAVVGSRVAPSGLAFTTCLFVGLFAATQTDRPGLRIGIALCGCLAVAWLMCMGLNGQANQHPESPPDPAGRQPRFPVGALVVLAGLLVGLVWWTDTRISATGGFALMEILSASGGTGDYDPSARGGIGDGEDLADSSNRPKSDGGDGENFIESDQRSFYDAVTESYGEPRPPKSQRAIPLAFRKLLGHQKAKAHKPGRKFSTRRESSKEVQTPRDIEADALLYVQGPTPLHLRLNAFGLFDGDTWHQIEADSPPMRIERKTWIQLPRIESNARTEPAGVQLKVGTLTSRQLPLPTQTSEFRVGIVDRTEFFSWAAQGVVQIIGESSRTTPGELIEATVDTFELADMPLAESQAEEDAHRWVPADTTGHDRIRQLAMEWTAQQTGVGAIDAIRAGLAARCQHNPNVVVPEDVGEPVDWFLFESREGPDYLFASATALMLRHLGYRTRLASGFYVDPDQFDWWTRHVLVNSANTHTWAEVETADHQWVPVEATPGYRTLGAKRTLWGWTKRLAFSLFAFLRANTGMVVAAVGVTSVGIVSRRWWMDRCCSWWWHCSAIGDNQTKLRTTVWLIDQRLRLAGTPRPAAMTFARWSLGAMQALPMAREPLLHVSECWSEHLYSSSADRSEQLDLWTSCRSSIRALSVKQLKTLSARICDEA